MVYDPNMTPMDISEYGNSSDGELTRALNAADKRLKLRAIGASYFRQMSIDKINGVGAAPLGVIKKHNEFKEQNKAGDTIRIPLGDVDFSGQSSTLADGLTNEVYGDKTYRGNAGKQALNLCDVIVNERGVSLDLPGNVAKQRIKDIDVFKAAGEQLAQKEGANFDIHCFSALCEGYSRNVLGTAARGGLAKTAIFHENCYAFGESLATSLNSVTLAVLIDDSTTTNNLNSVDVLTWDRVRNMSAIGAVKKIRHLPGEEYVLLAHPYSFKDLETSDSNLWATITSRAAERGKTNPLYQRARGYIANIALHENIRVPGIDSVDGTSVTWDYSGDATFSNCRAVFLLGMHALVHATTAAMRYVPQVDDHGRKSALAGFTFDGMTRGSFRSNSASSARTINEGSILFASYFETPTA
jgi:hypothetical protein